MLAEISEAHCCSVSTMRPKLHNNGLSTVASHCCKVHGRMNTLNMRAFSPGNHLLEGILEYDHTGMAGLPANCTAPVSQATECGLKLVWQCCATLACSVELDVLRDIPSGKLGPVKSTLHTRFQHWTMED